MNTADDDCQPKSADFRKKFWRRHPDLNRGWRSCRQGRDVYLVDSSCFLVGPVPPFVPVFGRYCSQLVPKFELEKAARRIRISGCSRPYGRWHHRLQPALADPSSNC